MKPLTILFLLMFALPIYSQSEGQSFCDGDLDASFFTFHSGKKYIIWQNTYYVEEITNTKDFNGKTYAEFEQTWENGSVYHLYLREQSGAIYQFEDCCDNDTVRLPSDLEIGKVWKTADGLSSYEIVSTSGTLETPHCDYTNLLVLHATFKNGSFNFYYQKGYGYIGTTVKDELISYVTPRQPSKD